MTEARERRAPARRPGAVVVALTFLLANVALLAILPRGAVAALPFSSNVRVNSDVGMTWQTSPSLAVDAGVLYAVWEDDRNGLGVNDDIYFAKSTDGGATWTNPNVRVNQALASAQTRPALAVRSGTIYVVWEDQRNSNYDIYFAKSTDGGATWTTPNVRVNEAAITTQQDPTIAVNSTGTIHVAWEDNRNGNWDVYSANSTDGGATWSTPNARVNDAAPGPQQDPSLAALAGSGVYVAWEDNRAGGADWDIYFARSADGGATWSNPNLRVDDGTLAIQTDPALTVDAGGALYATWDDFRSPQGIYFAISYNAGTTWDNPSLQVNDDPTAAFIGNPAVAVDPLGDVHVAWTDTRNTRDDVRYARSANGGLTWTDPSILVSDLASGTAFQYVPVLAADASGVYVAWEDVRNANRDVYFATDRDDPPALALLAPAGGEVWSSGSAHPVAWQTSDLHTATPSILIDLDYSDDAGLSWVPIVAGLAGDASPYAWTTPLTLCGATLVRTTAWDGSGQNRSATSPSFTMDCVPPSVTATAPQDGETHVARTADVVINFSEAMEANPTANSVSVAPNMPPGLAFDTRAWGPGDTQLALSHSLPFDPGVTYTITLSCTLPDAAQDVSDPGNLLQGCPIPFSFSFTANADPAVTVVSPNGGEQWTGGVPQAIAFSASDADDALSTVAVAFEYFDGVSWGGLGATTADQGSIPWIPPCVSNPQARIRATATDPWGASVSDESDSVFAVDCDAPAVTAVSPLDGATGVPLTVPVDVTFTEPMQALPTEGAFTLTNKATLGVVPGSFLWTSLTVLRFTPSASLGACTDYQVDVTTSALDSSSPGIPLATPFASNFSTACVNDPPTISLGSPLGGEIWTGGVPHLILFNAMDANDPLSSVAVTFEYSANNGATWAPVPGSTDATQTSYGWTPPCPGTTAALLRATATDPNTTASDTSAPFTVDCVAPTAALSPANGAVYVPLGSSVVAAFSEAIAGAPLVVLGQFDVTNADTGLPVAGSLSWNTLPPIVLTFAPTSPLSPCTNFTIALSGFADLSDPGNTMAPLSASFRSGGAGWCNAPPTVSISAPAGGERWSGGISHVIFFAASDPNDAPALVDVAFAFSRDGGATWIPLAGSYSAAETNLSWALWCPSTTAALIRATATDTGGLTAEDTSGPFATDCDVPSVTEVSPADGAMDVAEDVPVAVTFSEPMQAGPTEGAFLLLDVDMGATVPGTFSWNITGEILFFSPAAALASCTNYSVQVSAAALDASDPGLSPSGPSSAGFTTRGATGWCKPNAFPTVAILTPVSGAVWKDGENQSITWVMDDLETAKAALEVTLTYAVAGGIPVDVATLTGVETYTWSVPGTISGNVTFNVSVVDAKGGVGTDAVTVLVDSQRPVARVENATYLGSVGSGITFVSTSTDDTRIVRWTWEVREGDRVVATLEGPRPTWTPGAPGSYKVRLTIEDAAGRTDATDADSLVEVRETRSWLATWWWLLLLLVILVAVGGAAAVVIRRRRGREEKLVAPPSPRPPSRKAVPPPPPPPPQELLPDEFPPPPPDL